MPEEERQPILDDLRIPLHVEELSVSRHEIKKANIQIALITGTREQLIDEELTRVRVEVERVPIGRHRSRAVHQSGRGHHDHSGRGGNRRCRAAVGSQGRGSHSTREYKGAASGDRGAPRTGSCDHAGGG